MLFAGDREDPVERGGHPTGSVPATLPRLGEASARLVWATAPCLRLRARGDGGVYIVSRSRVTCASVHSFGLSHAIWR